MKKFRFILAFIVAAFLFALAAHTNVKHNHAGFIVATMSVFFGSAAAYFIPKKESRRAVLFSVSSVMWIFFAMYVMTIYYAKTHIYDIHDITKNIDVYDDPRRLNYAFYCAVFGILLLISGILIKKPKDSTLDLDKK